MHKPELTIIIPCYNCAATLEEAVDSCFTQGLTDFEIVMVDDGSTDNTAALMKDLGARHKEIKLFAHEKNMGGGATRNTAIASSSSDLIFCLDSDDMLAPGTLKKMVDFQRLKNCDAVGISTSIKFKGRNINNVAYTTNFKYVGEKIPFESFFEPSDCCALFSTFLHTRKAFEIAGGYPTTHGFDTQGFALRFLANGLIAYTCPDAVYLHRVEFHKSYYLREYESGKINHNWFSILTEFLYFFDSSAQKKILYYDLNAQVTYIDAFVRKLNPLLRPDYANYVTPGTQERHKEELLALTSVTDPYELFWLGSYLYSLGQFHDASRYLGRAIHKGLDCPMGFYKAYASLSMIAGKTYWQAEDEIKTLFGYKLQGSKLAFHKRVANKIRRILANQ